MRHLAGASVVCGAPLVLEPSKDGAIGLATAKMEPFTNEIEVSRRMARGAAGGGTRSAESHAGQHAMEKMTGAKKAYEA